MARELHDTLAHTLSGLTVQLETVKAYWQVDATAAQAMLDKSLEATRSGLQETRRALKSLRASPLDDLGLSLALRRLVESAGQRANLALDFSAPAQLPSLSPDVEQCIYRVAQEAVANVTHHANAKNLKVHLTLNGQDLSLLVQDDGRGFEEHLGENAEHFGLPGMRERAHLVGGQLTIDSRPGQGTTVWLIIKEIE
jgi:signal transduction histidine kinase